MNETSNRSPAPNRERGAVLVMVAVLLVVLVSFVALAVDVGYLYVTRNELQNVADGAALAGARTLGNRYQGLSYEAQQGYVCEGACAEAIREVAQEVAGSNRAGGVTMSVRDEDVEIGRWSGNAFTVNHVQPDAVRVTARRDGVLNTPVGTFFARVFGVDSVPVTALATAALTGQGTAVEGELELPIGISRWFFDNNPDGEFCNKDIKFYPSNDPDSCAGWTSWNHSPANDITLRRILDEDERYPNPDTIAGQSVYNFIGGALSNPTFDNMLSLFQAKGFDVDNNWNYLLDGNDNRINQATIEEGAVPLLEPNNQGTLVQATYPDGTLRNKHKWETRVVVYNRGDCSNPNQSIEIVGFAEVEVRDVVSAPGKLIRGFVKCNYTDADDTRGGGGEYGVKGSIPGLVQ